MTLMDYTLWSVSVAATLFSLLVLGASFASMFLYRRVRNLLVTLQHISDTSLEASVALKKFILTVGALGAAGRVFVSYKDWKSILKRVVERISETMKKQEEESHG